MVTKKGKAKKPAPIDFSSIPVVHICLKCGSEMTIVQGTLFDHIYGCVPCAFKRGHEEKVK